ncbi:uncharacterized protein LOC126188266 [Schistocerca cancellata]|uniref:uncharacterized protein LOC126188266 n=1 Tax=Schistocerca cancellata TaxID=274614 RepID=UPI00211970B5|nr:uncharacterized protein LOC126188266 [Schistocerca cancellata]
MKPLPLTALVVTLLAAVSVAEDASSIDVSNMVSLTTEKPTGPEKMPGEWVERTMWKMRWVREWRQKMIWVPVWKKVWGPMHIREWVPMPRAPPQMAVSWKQLHNVNAEDAEVGDNAVYDQQPQQQQQVPTKRSLPRPVLVARTGK